MTAPNFRKTLVQTVRRPAFWLGVVLLLSIIRGLPYLDFIPMWDAEIYGNCIAQATTGDLELNSVICAGHPTAAYFALLLLPNRLFGLHYGWVVFVNLILGAAALWAFYDTLRRQFPGRRYAPEILGMTALLSFHPMVMANAVSVNPDYGIYCFLLLFLNALQRRETLRTVLWGLFLVFSKEVGVLLFGLGTALQFIFDLAKRRYDLKGYLLRAFAFAVPPFLLGLHLLHKAERGPALWAGVTPKQIILNALLHFDSDDPVFRTYIAQIGILQFSWLAIVIIPLGWLRRGMALVGRVVLKTTSSIPRSGLFASLLLLGSTFLLTRFNTVCNARYFLALAPLILWVFYESLRAIVASRQVRMGVITAMSALLLASNYRTIDPVSKGLFGTFDFGAHPMLSLATYAHECCCQARDQLVYNVEHTHFHYLEEEIFRDLKSNIQEGRPLVVYPHSVWYNLGPLDIATRRRTLANTMAVSPTVVDETSAEAVAARVEHGYFVALPNCADQAFLSRLQGLFTLKKMKTYQRSGYAIDVYEMQRKS